MGLMCSKNRKLKLDMKYSHVGINDRNAHGRHNVIELTGRGL